MQNAKAQKRKWSHFYCQCIIWSKLYDWSVFPSHRPESTFPKVQNAISGIPGMDLTAWHMNLYPGLFWTGVPLYKCASDSRTIALIKSVLLAFYLFTWQFARLLPFFGSPSCKKTVKKWKWGLGSPPHPCFDKIPTFSRFFVFKASPSVHPTYAFTHSVYVIICYNCTHSLISHKITPNLICGVDGISR